MLENRYSAREYGITAVVGIEKATEIIKDGAYIRGEATNGLLQIRDGDSCESHSSFWGFLLAIATNTLMQNLGRHPITPDCWQSGGECF
ncbi:hypothetical protein SAMN03159341_10532 [Paenibacillus sp. 1_12]|uniref:hypothetical protein n=1 Tax=Paenibacillus sp. 1_12 TaxID=1566278 RepID=UPI0008EF384C|nr:hypothetical protein [Paenibacillus sp. 1_12]SFL31481.1 hypothetical protein SAMN03159341_10532 [Paenibacillus sp. 1_12]